MPNIDDLAEALRRADEVQNLLENRVAAVEIGATPRQCVPQYLWQVGVDDGRAIISLLRDRRFAAPALLRPQLEAVARGAWVRLLAPEGILEELQQGRGELPRLQVVLDEIRNHPTGLALRGERLDFTALYDRLKQTLHGHTHRGIQLISAVAHANAAQDDAVADWELPLLSLAMLLAATAAMLLLEDVGDTDSMQEVDNASGQFIEWLAARI